MQSWGLHSVLRFFVPYLLVFILSEMFHLTFSWPCPVNVWLLYQSPETSPSTKNVITNSVDMNLHFSPALFYMLLKMWSSHFFRCMDRCRSRTGTADKWVVSYGARYHRAEVFSWKFRDLLRIPFWRFTASEEFKKELTPLKTVFRSCKAVFRTSFSVFETFFSFNILSWTLSHRHLWCLLLLSLDFNMVGCS